VTLTSYLPEGFCLTSTIAAFFPVMLAATFMNMEHCVSPLLQAEEIDFDNFCSTVSSTSTKIMY
jgi:hypothetical protein